MTDYRPRNHDLLYHGRERVEDGLRVLTIFGSITLAVSLLVVAYLLDAYNPASTGFTAAIPSPASVAQQPQPALSLAASSRSGS